VSGPVEARVRAALARVPLFADLSPGDLRVAPLGGLTNASFRIDGPAGAFALRLAGPGTGDYIDRAAEAANARLAARAGLAPEVVFADPRDGTLVTRFVDGARPMDAAALRRPGGRERAVAVLRRLHGMEERFAGAFDPFAAIARYEALAARRGGALPDGFAAARAALRARYEALPAAPAVPCHGDPVPANFLDDGARAWLIDFEYAGNFDRLWDLAYLAAEAGLADADRDRLFRAYLDRPPTAAETARLALYALLRDLLAAAWGCARGGAAAAEACGRLARLRAWLARLSAGRDGAP